MRSPTRAGPPLKRARVLCGPVHGHVDRRGKIAKKSSLPKGENLPATFLTQAATDFAESGLALGRWLTGTVLTGATGAAQEGVRSSDEQEDGSTSSFSSEERDRRQNRQHYVIVERAKKAKAAAKKTAHSGTKAKAGTGGPTSTQIFSPTAFQPELARRPPNGVYSSEDDTWINLSHLGGSMVRAESSNHNFKKNFEPDRLVDGEIRLCTYLPKKGSAGRQGSRVRISIGTKATFTVKKIR